LRRTRNPAGLIFRRERDKERVREGGVAFAARDRENYTRLGTSLLAIFNPHLNQFVFVPFAKV
jgi:hypothetical protein